MTAKERRAAYVADTNAMYAAMQHGIEQAALAGLTRPADIAIMVKVDLDNAGFRIVRKPTNQRSQKEA